MDQMKTLFASVDLGGTNIKCAFADGDGNLEHADSVPTGSHAGPEAVLKRMADLVTNMGRETNQKPEAAGIGVPGLADLKSGVTRFLPNLPTQWRDVPVREILEPRIGCPVYLLNDVRMATLGELTYGHGKGNPVTMVFLALGTGIGGGVVVDGKLRLGPLGAAGELGHQTVVPDGHLCGCGSRGCLETVASGPAITALGIRLLLSGLAPKLHAITDGDPSKVSPKTIAEAVYAGDKNVRFEVERAAGLLGIGVANMVTALHPDLVVLGGGVAQMGDVLFDQVRRTVADRVRMMPSDSVEIKESKLGDRAGMLGGIALAKLKGLE
jgi:glucokinase